MCNKNRPCAQHPYISYDPSTAEAVTSSAKQALGMLEQELLKQMSKEDALLITNNTEKQLAKACKPPWYKRITSWLKNTRA